MTLSMNVCCVPSMASKKVNAIDNVNVIDNANLLFGPRAEMPGRGPANHGIPDPLSMTQSMSLAWPMTPVVPPVQRVRQCSGEHRSSQDSLTKVPDLLSDQISGDQISSCLDLA